MVTSPRASKEVWQNTMSGARSRVQLVNSVQLALSDHLIDPDQNVVRGIDVQTAGTNEIVRDLIGISQLGIMRLVGERNRAQVAHRDHVIWKRIADKATVS